MSQDEINYLLAIEGKATAAHLIATALLGDEMLRRENPKDELFALIESIVGLMHATPPNEHNIRLRETTETQLRQIAEAVERRIDRTTSKIS